MSANPVVDLSVLAPPVPVVPALRVETVSDFDALLALEPAWNTLLDEAGIAHPFLRHEWIRTWWESFGQGKRLHVVVVWAGSEPVGIAPLMICREPMYGLRVRRLQLIANVHTQRSDFIVGRWKDRVYPAIWECLASQRALWDVLVLPQLPVGSPTLDRLPALAVRSGFRVGTWRGPDSPRLRLTGTWDDYFNGLDRKHRSNLRNRLKRLSALGPVAMEVVTDGPALLPALEEGLRIEAAAWKGQAGTAIGCHAELRRFYGGFAARAAAAGWLRLHFLTVGGRRIAFGYWLCYQKKLYLLKPGYDPEYARYSPFNLLCSMVLREAFASGIRVHDFLGASDTWKRDWTPEAKAHFWLFVFGGGPRARLLRVAKFRVVPQVKRVVQACARLAGQRQDGVPAP